MEIFHVFGIHWKLLTAQMVNFAIALFVLYRYAYKPIFDIIAKRQGIIAKGLEDAATAAQEMEKVQSEKGAILASAREEGGKLSESLRKQAIEQEQGIIRAAQEKSAALFAEARQKAAAESEHLMRESEKEIARMAVLASEKILRNQSPVSSR